MEAHWLLRTLPSLQARLTRRKVGVKNAVVLATGTTDDKGRFRMNLNGVSNKSHSGANVIARTEGMGLVWKQISLEKSDPKDELLASVELKLEPEQIMSVRLVDLEGEPANELEISIKSIMASSNEPQSSLVCRKAKQECKAWLPSLDCDDEGRFKVYGVPRGHGFRIEVKGDDRFAPQGLSLNTGESEERGESDATYRDLVKNVKPGEEAVFTLEPAKIFKGRVIFADTGKPVPDTKVSVWASQQEMGSMFVKSGKTNEAGEFKLRPNPGIRFGLSAFAPDGTPYFGIEMPPVEWKGGDNEKTIDVKLKRGVLVSGIVKNEETGEPVVGAPIQYHPLGADSSNVSGDIITGWEAIQKTDKDGRFKSPSCQGPVTCWFTAARIQILC